MVINFYDFYENASNSKCWVLTYFLHAFKEAHETQMLKCPYPQWAYDKRNPKPLWHSAHITSNTKTKHDDGFEKYTSTVAQNAKHQNKSTKIQWLRTRNNKSKTTDLHTRSHCGSIRTRPGVVSPSSTRTMFCDTKLRISVSSRPDGPRKDNTIYSWISFTATYAAEFYKRRYEFKIKYELHIQKVMFA